MKFLVIGLGSMGKRRIRNLQYLKKNDILGWDLRANRRKECEDKYKIKSYENIDEALTKKPDAIIISTPPDHHLEYQLLATKNKIHFFCEAGISTDGFVDLIPMVEKQKIIAAPSATLRFNDSIKKIKELIKKEKIGNIVAFTYHMGQYLPDWHPWENISKFYVGKRKTSATREMVPFELEWLTWIFGDINKISCMKGKISNLKVDIDDVYQLIFQFKSGIIGHLLVDVISRSPTRIIRIVGEKGTVYWDWMEDIVRLFDSNKEKWFEFEEKKGFKENGYVAKENMYIDEINNFINAINGKEKYIYSLEEDFKILKLLEAVEESAEKEVHINLK